MPRAFVLGLALFVFGSCQDSGDSPTGTQGSVTYLATLPTAPGTWAVPDSAIWIQGSASSFAELETDGLEAVASRTLDTPPSDTIHIELWRLGITYGAVRYRHAGTPNLAYVGRDLDAFALAVLSHVGTSGSRDSLHIAYAKALLDDSLAKLTSYPDRAPRGLDTAAVTRELAIAMASAGKPYAEMIANRSIDLDSAALRARIEALTDSGVIRDTTILFGGRDLSAPRIERQDGTRDTTVDHATDSIRVSWKITDDRRLDSVLIGDGTIEGKDDLFTRTVALVDGRNEILVVAVDAAGNRSTDTVLVTRRPAPVDTIHPDTTAPVVARRSGTRDTSVADAVDSITLAWTITDDRKLALVRIGGEAVTSADSVYQRRIALAEGANVVRCEAVDAAGNRAFDAIAVIRRTKVDTVHPDTVRPDTTAPTIVRAYPFQDTLVGAAVAFLDYRWMVKDDRGLALVSVDGEIVTSGDSLYKHRLVLRADTSYTRIVAVDRSGNIARDSMRVVRVPNIDRIAPRLKRVAGTADTTVGAARDSALSVGWVVREETRISSVTIDGVAVPSLDSVYTRVVPIAVGTDTIRIVATDAAGNVARDSIVVRRSAYRDTTKPSIVAADTTTRDKQVNWFTRNVTLRWTITDNDQVKASWFTNCEPVINGNTYSCTYPLAVGRNTFTAKAYDTAGNSSSRTVVITRDATIDTLVASWAFPSKTTSVIKDLTGHGLDLNLANKEGRWKRSFDSALSCEVTGKLLIQARVRLDRYPSNIYNNSAVVVGTYGGLTMLVTDLGELTVVSQRATNSGNTWYAPRTAIGSIPVGRSVSLAIGGDRASGKVHAWIDGVAQPLWTTSAPPTGTLRLLTDSFAVGYSTQDGQQFLEQIDSIKVFNRYVLGAGNDNVTIKPCVATFCMDHPDTVATWTFTSDTMSTVASTPSGLDLTKHAKGQWKRAWDTSLVPALPSGRILYKATVRLSAYPPATTYNGVGMVMGFYPGVKIGVDTAGCVVVTAQRNGRWYGVRTAAKAVALNTDVSIAVGADQALGELFVWINGNRVTAYRTSTAPAGTIRTAGSSDVFAIGYDDHDGQAFPGTIMSAAVYKDFVLGRPYFPE